MTQLHKEGPQRLGAMATSEGSQYLTFTLAGERFAVDILDIHEIIEVSLMTLIPLAPDFVRGIVNLRGSVLPVIDLAVRLGRVRQELSKRSCIVVVEAKIEGQGQLIGMLVDEVSEILDIRGDQLRPPPNFGSGPGQTRFIAAMGRIDDVFIILLDTDHVLSRDDLGQMAQITAHMAAQA
jgi:purine-binding chemotaxis protein CheW